MKNFRIEVFADQRPIPIFPDIVHGSNHGVAVRRGYEAAKEKIRRGTKVVTVRAYTLGGEIKKTI